MSEETGSVPTPEEISMMEECLEDAKSAVIELENYKPSQWNWYLAMVSEARRRLRLKHDREISVLTLSLIEEVIAAAKSKATS